jgi:predicted nuclease of predicted toxin-antitoxin system
MRFLADESCDFFVVRALRAAGHDVMAVAEVAVGALDDAVLDLAVREQRVLLTEDKDFGQLVYAATRSSSGVILMRFPVTRRASLVQAVLDLVSSRDQKLSGCFAVVQPGRIRISTGR